MNKETNMGQQTAPPKKDNRNLIFGILIALLLGTWGYIIFDKSTNAARIEDLKNQYTNVDSGRSQVQQLYNASLARLDSLSGYNLDLTDSLKEKSSAVLEKTREIANLRSEIKAIMNKKEVTLEELSTAREKIAELNTTIDDFVIEFDKLKNDNQDLFARNEQFLAEKASLEKDLERLRSAKRDLEGVVDIGSTLHASNFNIVAINEKSGGEEKKTTTAKRVDKLRIMFDLDVNRIAKTGQKELYVCLYDPEGKPISIPAYGSGTFSTREEGKKFFTNRVVVRYDQGKRTPVSFDWRQNKPFQPGTYKVVVYHNGFKIGEGSAKLKKGGLFS